MLKVHSVDFAYKGKGIRVSLLETTHNLMQGLGRLLAYWAKADAVAISKFHHMDSQNVHLNRDSAITSIVYNVREVHNL